MIETSAAYKEAVDSHYQQWDVYATIDYTDYNLDNSIAPVVSESDRLSDDAQLADGIEVTTFDFFAGWEHFEWGQHFRSEESTIYEKGALSEQLSDADGDFGLLTGQVVGFTAFSDETTFHSFEDYPRFSVTFSPRTVSTLKVVFDEKLGQWATDFDVRIWTGATVDTTESVTGNTSYRWTTTLSSAVLQATKVEVVVKSWNKAIAKAKVVESFTSIQEQYESQDIIELSVYEESEPDDATIPIGNVTANTCTLKLINQDNKFDNDNELSVIAGQVIKNRRIKPYAILAGERVPLGIFYSQKWKVSNIDQSAEVSAQDLISLMEDQEYASNQFITPGADQDFEYTSTADFNTFTFDNAEAGTDEIVMGDADLRCNGDSYSENIVGFTAFSSLTPFSGSVRCGIAERTISYTYTPGTTVTLSLSTNETLPIGTNVQYYVSYASVEDYHPVEDTFIFTPEDISTAAQQVKIKAVLTSQSDVSPSVQDISVTLSETVTLYSLGAKLIDDFDDVTGLVEGAFTIDQKYGEIEIPNAYFEPQKYRDILQTLTEAAGGRAYIGRQGNIVLEQLQPVTTAMKAYDSSNYFDKVQPVNPTNLYNRVTVVTKPLKQAASSETIAEPQIEIADGETINTTVFYDEQPADTVTFSGLPASVTIDDSTIYTWGADLTISNASGSDQDFTLTVSGKPYRVTGSRRVQLDNSESIRKNGVIEYVIDDNPLIQTIEQANFIASTMIDSFGTLRRTVEIDALPDPSLEVGDTITTDGYFYNVNSQEIEYRQGEITQVIGGKA